METNTRVTSRTTALWVFCFGSFLLQMLFFVWQGEAQITVIQNRSTTSAWFLYLSYTASLAGTLSLALALLFGLFQRLSPQGLRAKLWLILLVGMESVLLLLWYLDSKVYNVMGVHLDSYFVWKGVLAGGLQREVEVGWSTVLTFMGIVLGILALHLVLLWLSRRALWRGPKLQKRAFMGMVVLLVVSFGTMAWGLKDAHKRNDPVVEALPLYGLFHRQQTIKQGSLAARYPKMQKAPKLKRRKSVVFILAESFRGDMLTPTYTPNMMRFLKQNQCIRSKHHFSGGNSTSWGTFSYLYGLNAYNFLPFHKKKIRSTGLEVLRKNGYQILGMSAARFRGWDHIDFVMDQFKPYTEYAQHKSYTKDIEMLKAVEKFQRTRDKDKPFFLFLFFYATHHNYYYPKSFEKDKPAMPENYNHFMSDYQMRKFRKKIHNRYKNSVRFVDHMFHRVTQIFKDDIKRKDLVVAFSGDHGEEFWDHGLLGHGATRCINARTRVPLVYCMPDIKTKTVALSSHTDMMPTLLDYLQPQGNFSMRRYFDGHSLLRKLPSQRTAVVTGPGFPYKNPKLCLQTKTHKYWLKRQATYNQFKITQASDLNDKKLPLSSLKQRKQEVARLSRQMNKFLRVRNAVFQDQPKVQFPVGVRFGDFLELVGYDLSYDSLLPGNTIIIKYTFKVLKHIPARWRLFFHLHIKQPNQFLNMDHPLVDGTYPLHRWKPGEYVQDEHIMWVPFYYKQGKRIQLSLGMWSRKQGRQPITKNPRQFPAEKRTLQLFDKVIR